MSGLVLKSPKGKESRPLGKQQRIVVVGMPKTCKGIWHSLYLGGVPEEVC